MNLTNKISAKLLTTTLSASLLVAIMSGCSTTNQSHTSTYATSAQKQQLNTVIESYKQGSSLPY